MSETSDILYSELPKKLTPVASQDQLLITDSENGNIVCTLDATLFRGPGILSIEKTGEVGLVVEYTIFLSDGNSYKFYVTNGEKGMQWISGGYSDIIIFKKDDVTFFEGSSFIYINDNPSAGNSPPNVEVSEKNDYWELFSRRGEDGKVVGAGDMHTSVYDPTLREEPVAFQSDLDNLQNIVDNISGPVDFSPIYTKGKLTGFISDSIEFKIEYKNGVLYKITNLATGNYIIFNRNRIGVLLSPTYG